MRQRISSYLSLILVAVLVSAAVSSAIAATSARATVNKRVDLTAQDAPIHDVLTFLAKEGRFNVVLTPAVKGKVTVHFRRIKIRDALRAVVRAQGYQVAWYRNTCLVMSQDEYLRTLRRTRRR